jgi:AcrR family transcriptional regulator
MNAPVEKARAPRRQRADGVRTRRTILEAAVRLATVEGLEGLSIGRLAVETGMSKSGLFAHFGSKEELQLAAIEEARRFFVESVVEPALRAPDGLARLKALCEAFFDWVKLLPGGCFFASAAAEMKARPGRVKERVAAQQREWIGLLRSTAEDARTAGLLAKGTDATELASQLSSLLLGADVTFLLQDDPSVLVRARETVLHVLEAHSA